MKSGLDQGDKSENNLIQAKFLEWRERWMRPHRPLKLYRSPEVLWLAVYVRKRWSELITRNYPAVTHRSPLNNPFRRTCPQVLEDGALFKASEFQLLFIANDIHTQHYLIDFDWDGFLAGYIASILFAQWHITVNLVSLCMTAMEERVAYTDGLETIN